MIFGLVNNLLTFVSRSSEEDEKLVLDLDKVGELSSLESPHIAGALIKRKANEKAKT